MARVYLVRHGKAASGFSEATDPPLSDEGNRQAADLAHMLMDLGPLPILSSPLLRARETAGPLAKQWGVEPAVSAAVAEIPTPEDVLALGLVARGDWLRRVSRQRYSELNAGLRAWRQGVVDKMLACPGDTVVFTHFMVINAALGAATDDDRLVIAQPGYCSVYAFETIANELKLVQTGRQADTVVL